MAHPTIKWLALIVWLASSALTTSASAKDTLIDLDNARVGGYGGPMFKSGQIQNEQTFEIGASGGATFTTGRHSIALGGGIYSLANELDWDIDERLEMSYGGLILGYTYNPEALAHVDTQLLLGAGGVTMVNLDGANSDGTFLVSELTTQVSVNVTDFMAIGLGASFRQTSDPGIIGLGANDLSSPGFFISFQFGSL
ncbi:hypothetical protein [Reinekea forsetii]|jgi:hypothetical protein|uniref:Outer membrane protein beta-barrel domain-containing protein n=1 Tax=Reinekea forsetii TaxID=1336806 RepID=A0A2K8KU89_9GAMM|nr:hypothetical protein [Reinekea forsetii]ATX78315.1 hypothetical protein REIFOR_03209 [Reinekea forsetii]